ncbi:MAG TPA: hypothetical protein VK212_08090 [Lentimicrobium sp.]|nr:hypothetical protein [Lentimicrobium sp.]
MIKTFVFITVLLSINALSAQTLCDTKSEMVWFILEHPPIPNLTDNELEIKLNSVIDPSLLESYKADYLYITFFVNCKGEDFNYKLAKRQDGKVQKDSLSNFQEVFLSQMQSLLSWFPGTKEFFEKGKPIEKTVDFQGSYTILVDGSKFHILNEKEKKKHFEQKPKK